MEPTDIITMKDFTELGMLLYKKFARFMKAHEPEERLRKQYPNHSLFCECVRCLPSERKYRTMQRELQKSMS